MPSWYKPDPPELAAQRLPPDVLSDIDVLAAYFASVLLKNVPGAEWVIGRLPKRMQYEAQNKPLVKLPETGEADPVAVPYSSAVRVVLLGTSAIPTPCARPTTPGSPPELRPGRRARAGGGAPRRTLEGEGDERYIALETLVATLFIVRNGGLTSIEVGVSGHEAAADERGRDFEQLLARLEQLGTVYDVQVGLPLVGSVREAAIHGFARIGPL